MSKNDTAVEKKEKRKVLNRFNRLTSKEWLPFQKSWFKFTTKEKLYRENLRFFLPAGDGACYYYGSQVKTAEQVAESEKIILTKQLHCEIQFAIFDLLDTITGTTSLSEYELLKISLLKEFEQAFVSLSAGRFITVFIRNVFSEGKFMPFAWDLAKEAVTIFSLKDEKIGCVATDGAMNRGSETFYCLYFRKDEHAGGKCRPVETQLLNDHAGTGNNLPTHSIPSWFVLKPQPRKKDEILHPAKFPEDLPEMFIGAFTQAGAAVFDPMSGTGSTQLAALKLGRNAYGTELSDFFAAIARQRCAEFLKRDPLNGPANRLQCRIELSDARLASQNGFPVIDYMITSPPYWDMLNMKGAEYQARRIEKGLQTNYSDDAEDLGNIAAYDLFLDELTGIYLNVVAMMKPGSCLTIVVKNIKKKGRNYPFAWDLASRLAQHLELLPEAFWCQDDISIAPFGYGNTWVSNTFHQYCLTFRVPLTS